MKIIGSEARVNRLNIALKAVFVGFFIGYMALTFTVSAETLEMDTNECTYMPEINKDYCYTEYMVCDNTIDINKISLKYADITERKELKVTEEDLKLEIPELNTEIDIKAESPNCYKVELKGWKSPLIDIDHVLLYDDVAHLEFAWWNASYIFKNAIYGHVTDLSEEIAGFVPINITLNTTQLLWCNLTKIGKTNSTLGWIYWNDDNDYACIDANETTRLDTVIDEGAVNMDYGSKPFGLSYWFPLNNTLDDLIVRSQLTNDGTVQVNGKIGYGRDFEASSQDSLKTASLSNFDSSNAYTACLWYNYETVGEQYLLDYRVSGASQNFYVLTSGTGASCRSPVFVSDGVSTTSNYCGVVDRWDFACFNFNTTDLKVYINGELNSSALYGGQSHTTGELTIGIRYQGGSAPFDGIMDNIMFYERTLTDDEIRLLYWSGLNMFPYGATTSQNISITDINLTVLEPENISYSSLTIPLTISANDSINSSWYFLNSGSKTYFTPNTTFTGITGSNEISVFVNNSVGNSDNETVYFNVSIPAVPVPAISYVIQGDLPIQDTYCSVTGDYVVYRERLTCGSDGCFISNQTDTANCYYGCDNFTLTNWGNAGCIENEYMIAILTIIFAIVGVGLVRLVFK